MEKVDELIHEASGLVDLACRPDGPETQQVCALVANATATLALVELLKGNLAAIMQEYAEVAQELESLRALHGD